MKKLLIAALAVSALVQTGHAASRRGIKRPVVQPVTVTQKKGNHAQTVKTEIVNLEKSIDTLWNKTDSLSGTVQRFMNAENDSVNELVESVQDLIDPAYAIDEDFIKDVVSEDQIKEIQAKIGLYNTVVSVLGHLDSQVKSEVSSIRNVSNKDTAVLAARETSIKERAQNMLIALAFHDAVQVRSGENTPVLANMCAIAQKIQHAERLQDTDLLENSITARLKDERRFLHGIGFATERGDLVEDVSYQSVVSVLTSNLFECEELSNKLRAVRKNGAQDTTKIAKEIVALARKADDAMQIIKAYPARKKNILERAYGLRNEKRAMVIMQTLKKLEAEFVKARKNLSMYDFAQKSISLQLFYDRYYRSAAVAESFSWLKPVLGLAIAAVGGYYFFGTDQGKEHVASARRNLPEWMPGHTS